MPIRMLADLREVEAPPWIWTGFLAPANITLLAAAPKVGKTTFVSHLIRAMWSQDDFLGAHIRPVPTLIISEEADTLIASRCDAMGYSEMWPIGWLTPEPGRTWDVTLQQARWYASHYHNPLIIIDTLSRHWGIDDENDNAKVESALNPVIAMARQSGCAVLLVHHTRKSGGSGGLAARGGSAIVGAADIIVELQRSDRGSRSSQRRIETYSRYEETPESLDLTLRDGEYVPDDEATPRTGGDNSGVRRWLLLNPGWWTADSIAAACDIPVRTVRDALGSMSVTDSVLMRGRGTRGAPYQYGINVDEDNSAEEVPE